MEPSKKFLKLNDSSLQLKSDVYIQGEMESNKGIN